MRPVEHRDALAAAMQVLQPADALIIDMRANGGGSPDTVALLISYLIEGTGQALFEIVHRDGSKEVYRTPEEAPATRNARRPIYVLTSARTFSGGEGLAFLLQELKRALVIGEVTAGAANPGRPYPAGELFEITVPNGRVLSTIRPCQLGRPWCHAGHQRACRGRIPRRASARARRCDRGDGGPGPSRSAAEHSSESGKTLRKSRTFQRCNVRVTAVPSFLRPNRQEER